MLFSHNNGKLNYSAAMARCQIHDLVLVPCQNEGKVGINYSIIERPKWLK